MNEHSPGPWHRFGLMEVRGVPSDLPHLSNGPLIARIPPAMDIPLEERAANAQLIAAAPELLEALESAEVELSVDQTLGRKVDAALLSQMRRAIAKARGVEAKAEAEAEAEPFTEPLADILHLSTS